MNDLSKVVDKLLAQGLLALRGTCVMPRLVNSDYSNLAAQQGASIDVPIPSAIKAQAVTPGATSQDTGDISPVSATIKLDRWMEAPFYLTDKDLMEANRGVIPMQASEAVKAIANDVNATLLGLGRKFYGMVGTPGTTPFSTVVDATNARKVLNRQLAPVNDRRIVLDPDAEAAALGLSGFADVSKSGDARPIIDGTIGRKYGFDWAMDQQVPTFEASVMTEGALTVNGANEAGAQVVSLAKATNAAGLKEGDILTIAGDTQTYVVTEAVSLAVGNTAVKIYPGLARPTTGSEAVTVSGSHVMNLAFHRDAIAFATRPLMDSANGLGNLIQSAVDPVSGCPSVWKSPASTSAPDSAMTSCTARTWCAGNSAAASPGRRLHAHQHSEDQERGNGERVHRHQRGRFRSVEAPVLELGSHDRHAGALLRRAERKQAS